MLLYPINRRNVNNAGTSCSCAVSEKNFDKEPQNFMLNQLNLPHFDVSARAGDLSIDFFSARSLHTSIRFASQISSNMLFHCILMSFNAMSEFSEEWQTTAGSFKYSSSSSFNFYPRSFRVLKHFYWRGVCSAIIKNKMANFIVLIQATHRKNYFYITLCRRMSFML